MFHDFLICAVAAMAVIATSCEHLNKTGLDKSDETTDRSEVVTIVVSSELGTVYGMEGEPSEGMKFKEDGKNDWHPANFREIEGFEYIRER